MTRPTGRFIQRDPGSPRGRLNVYEYSQRGASAAVDPSGLMWLPLPPVLRENARLPRDAIGWLRKVPKGMKIVWIAGQRVLVPIAGAAGGAAAGAATIAGAVVPVACVVAAGAAAGAITGGIIDETVDAFTGRRLSDLIGEWIWEEFWPKPEGMPGGYRPF